MKDKASSLTKQLFLLGTLSILGACGSTQPSNQQAVTVINVSSPKEARQSVSSVDSQALNMLIQISGSLAKKNQQPDIWRKDISNYESHKVARATSKYVDLSERVYTISDANKCSTRHLRFIKQAMVYHPSSLPMLSVLLDCANQYDMVDAQTSIADSIVSISSELIGSSQNGFSDSTPLKVREVYEAEYLLDLAGIDLFDTEMVVEKDRILIMHHGIDSVTNQYSLTYADQTDFFISSIKATLSDSELTYFDDISSIIDIKKQALLSSQHYAVQIDSYRNMLFDGEYGTLLETINTRQQDTPLALAFLAQAHMALGTFDAQISVQDDLVYYAQLGIPELQSVASQALLRIDVEGNVGIVSQAFMRTVDKIGLENASYLWVRTFLADSEFNLYLDLLAKQFDSNVVDAWKQSLTNFAGTRPQLSSSLRTRIKDFYTVLQSHQASDIAMLGTQQQ
jgi:hypothetical protein